MQSPATVESLLQNTLNPNLTNQAHVELQKISKRQGFASELLIIADKADMNINIRQSALVTLKNLIKDEVDNGKTMHKNDWDTIKSSALEGNYVFI